MGTRGPKSKDDLTVVPTKSAKHVAPPDWLNGDAKAEWKRIVSSLPAYHLDENQAGLLEQYVRHRVEACQISRLLQAAAGEAETDMQHYDRLLKMQQKKLSTTALGSVAEIIAQEPSTAASGRLAAVSRAILIDAWNGSQSPTV